MRNWPADGVALGADYNPEQWPEQVWPDDVARMQEAGVTFATVGVFSWSLLEPAQGRYTFGWPDRVLDLLHSGGIAVDLATATPSPPPWFSHAYPETLPVDREGRTRRGSWLFVINHSARVADVAGPGTSCSRAPTWPA